MEFYEIIFFIRDDSPKLLFEYWGSGKDEPGWLKLMSGCSPFVSLHLPNDREARAAVLAGMRSSLNKAIDQAEADAVPLDAEVVEPELAGRMG